MAIYGIKDNKSLAEVADKATVDTELSTVKKSVTTLESDVDRLKSSSAELESNLGSVTDDMNGKMSGMEVMILYAPTTSVSSGSSVEPAWVKDSGSYDVSSLALDDSNAVTISKKGLVQASMTVAVNTSASVQDVDILLRVMVNSDSWDIPQAIFDAKTNQLKTSSGAKLQTHGTATSPWLPIEAGDKIVFRVSNYNADSLSFYEKEMKAFVNFIPLE